MQIVEEKTVEDRQRGKRLRLTKFNKHNHLNGVCFYLHDKGLKNAEEQHYVIKLYVIHMEWEDIPLEKHVLEACTRIQEDFKSFITWFHSTKNAKTKV